MLVQNINTFTIGDVTGTYSSLPKGTYALSFSNQVGLYLTKIEDFVLPKKMYGDLSISDRWIKSYESSDKGIGVLLSGTKGTGKTVLAKKAAVQSNKPVIVVSNDFDGANIAGFLTKPEFYDSVIFIDEFEKVFRDSDHRILSLLDGVTSTKLLSILTCNDQNNLNTYVQNRPGRIKYHINYRHTPSTVVNEIIEDLLLDKTQAESLKSEFRNLSLRTNDILITIIKDMNLFNESASDVIKHLYLKKSYMTYKVTMICDDNSLQLGSIKASSFYDIEYNQSISTESKYVITNKKFFEKYEHSGNYVYVNFNAKKNVGFRFINEYTREYSDNETGVKFLIEELENDDDNY
jgi:hypothetical protein